MIIQEPANATALLASVPGHVVINNAPPPPANHFQHQNGHAALMGKNGIRFDEETFT